MNQRIQGFAFWTFKQLECFCDLSRKYYVMSFYVHRINQKQNFKHDFLKFKANARLPVKYFLLKWTLILLQKKIKIKKNYSKNYFKDHQVYPRGSFLKIACQHCDHFSCLMSIVWKPNKILPWTPFYFAPFLNGTFSMFVVVK